MAMIGKIRRLHYRQQKSVREIARITSLSRNAVRKWLKAPVAGEPKYRRGTRPGKLTAFHEALQQALKADGHRPKRNRLRNRIEGPSRPVLSCSTAQEWFAEYGAEPGGDPPDMFAASIRAEHTKWGPIIRQLGIRVE